MENSKWNPASTTTEEGIPVTLESLRIATQQLHAETLGEIEHLVAQRACINDKIRVLREKEADERRACKALDKNYGVDGTDGSEPLT